MQFLFIGKPTKQSKAKLNLIMVVWEMNGCLFPDMKVECAFDVVKLLFLKLQRRIEVDFLAGYPVLKLSLVYV